MDTRRATLAALVLLAAGAVAAPPEPVAARAGGGEPATLASVDLGTRDGAAAVQATWRYHDVAIVPVSHRSPGPDLRPSGPPNRTFDIEPKAGAADFDDAAWEVIDPASLKVRRASGRLSFNWYRLSLTVPAQVDGKDVRGTTVYFELTVDDYAEVWVNGELPVEFGRSGGPLVAGWNAPNRLVVARNAQPGQQVRIAVFGANGPLSDPPGNFIWLRQAKLDFVHESGPIRAGLAEIDRLDPALDAVLGLNPYAAKLAGGFQFGEGPVWSPEGDLLFSDPNANRIYRYVLREGATHVYREQSGYQGADVASYSQPGSNGLAFDREGRLTIDEHGNRRVTRLEKDGTLTVLADRYEGKRLNSPNDLVYRSDGSLYFTDPPFGLPKFFEDPRKELPFSGVFLVRDGRLTLVSRDLEGPNGVAFSPDERYLYVTNWDPAKKVVMRYEVRADGTLANGKVFFDMGGAPGEEALDGVKVDALGNLFVSGPGGVWILSPDGTHIGQMRLPELPANFAWGDADGRSLYMTARTGLYRIRLGIPGAGRGTPAATN